VSGIAPKRSESAGNPFASLKQEKTVEAKVAGHLLDIAKGVALGGDTSVYHVPRELLEMARRKTKAADARLKPVVAPRAGRQAGHGATGAPTRVRPSDPSLRPSAPAESSRLPPILGRPLRALKQLGGPESTALERALLRGSIATVTWVALIYAAYRLIRG
jgi:hypothetical protein